MNDQIIFLLEITLISLEITLISLENLKFKWKIITTYAIIYRETYLEYRLLYTIKICKL